MGFERLPSGALNNYQLLEKEISIDKEGFLYIFVANESPDDQGVWFDDFKVEVTKSKVTGVSDYYPFGMLQAGNSTNSGDPTGNKYLYNGKELQEDLGLQWYDYGARMYQADVGRWFAVDPLEQFHSPYNYAGNNPISVIDPTGMWAETADSYFTDDPDEIVAFMNSLKSNKNRENGGGTYRKDEDGNWQQEPDGTIMHRWIHENGDIFEYDERSGDSRWITAEQLKNSDQPKKKALSEGTLTNLQYFSLYNTVSGWTTYEVAASEAHKFQDFLENMVKSGKLSNIPTEAAGTLKIFKSLPAIGFATGVVVDWVQYQNNPDFNENDFFKSLASGVTGIYSTMGGAAMYFYMAEPTQKAIRGGYPTGYMGAQNPAVFKEIYNFKKKK